MALTTAALTTVCACACSSAGLSSGDGRSSGTSVSAPATAAGGRLSAARASPALSARAALSAVVGERSSISRGEASPRDETSREEWLTRFGFGFALSHSRARVTRWSCRSSGDSAAGAQLTAGLGAEAPAPKVSGCPSSSGCSTTGGPKGLYKDIILPLSCPPFRFEGELVSLGGVTGEVS